jgi:hypothetical protein
MDVFEELIRDHRVTEQRFAEIEQTTDRELERRQGLFRKEEIIDLGHRFVIGLRSRLGLSRSALCERPCSRYSHQ